MVGVWRFYSCPRRLKMSGWSQTADSLMAFGRMRFLILD